MSSKRKGEEGGEEGDQESPSKRHKESEDTKSFDPKNSLATRLLLDKGDVGSLIGKGGATIKKYREESKTEIDIDEIVEGSRKRVVSVKGDLERTFQTIMWMGERILERKREQSQKGDSGEGLLELCLLVFNPIVGSIIGKGGASVKQLREGSGCEVKISKTVLEGSTDKTIQLSGTESQFRDALKPVLEKIWEGHENENIQRRMATQVPYEPRREVLNTMARGGRRGGGGGGGGGASGGGGALTTISGGYGVIGGGSVEGMSPFGAQVLVNPYSNHLPLLGSLPFQQPYAALGGIGGFGFGGPGAQSQFAHLIPTPPPPPQPTTTTGGSGGGGAQTEIILSVPESVIGSVIGRGGDTISDIRHRSGANVNVEKKQSRKEDRKVTVSGTLQAVELATQMINSVIAAAASGQLQQQQQQQQQQDGSGGIGPQRRGDGRRL